MESRRLRFDAEGHPIEFTTWQRQATRYLTSQRQDGATLWAHASGALKAPLSPDPLPLNPQPTPAVQADYDRRVLARDVWDSRDAATALALTELLPPTEAIHFAQVETAQGIWDAIVARYSTPSSASLSRLLMLFLFPDLGSFSTASDLMTHLRSLDTGFRAACTNAQLLVAPPPMWLTVHCNLLSVASATDAVPPHLFAGNGARVARRAGREVEGAVVVAVELGAVVVAAAAVVPQEEGALEKVQDSQARLLAVFRPAGCRTPAPAATAAPATAETAAPAGTVAAAGTATVPALGAPSAVGSAAALGPPTAVGSRRTRELRPQQQQFELGPSPPSPPCDHWCLTGRGSPCVCGGNDHSAARCFRRLDNLYRARWGPEATTPHWACLLARKIHVFDLSMDDARQYALFADVDYSADGSVCSRVRRLACMPPTSLDLCLSSLGACVASTPGSPQAVASLSFTLDSGASQCFFRHHTTLTLLLSPVPVALADPSSGPAVARSSTTLPCPVVPSGVLRGLHIPSFTRKLVGVGYLQDRGITVTFVGDGRTAVCTHTVTGRILATFTREPRSGLYVLHTEHSPVSTSPQVAASPQVPAPPPVVKSNQVAASPPIVAFGQVVASCSCRSFTHRTVQWHHRLGHPSIPRLRSMASHRLVSGLPHVFPSPGVGSAFRVWGCLALVRDTSADKLSARAVPCVFLGFPVASADWSFYHPPLHQFLDSRDVRFDESMSYYTRYPCRGLPVPPPPLFLAPSLPPTPAPPVPPPPRDPAPSGVSHATPLPSVARQVASPSPQSSSQSPQQPSVLPRQVTVDSVGVGAGGVATGGTWSGGARSRGAGVGGAGAGSDSPGGAGAGGPGTRGASSRGAGVGGPGTGGARIGGAGAGDPDPVGTPSGDTGSEGASSEATGAGGTSLRRPVYGLRQSSREWHDTLRPTLRDLGFCPSSADPSLFVRAGSTPFFILVYVDDLVFATPDRAALAEVKSELQKRHTCTGLGELQRYLGLQITRDRAARTITLTQLHMVQQVLQHFEFLFSTTQPTPLAVDQRLTSPFPDEPFEPSGPYPELVGCLMYLMTCM
ncbi:unnamed protein product [Closterium sp. NIES-54]